ncbi:MAG: TonB-dependent receptor [Ignavibacteriales bacterium]|nr:TonB-dependent receptor [Ignavibacteriales bacterium]
MKYLLLLLLSSFTFIAAQETKVQKDTMLLKFDQITVTATRYAENLIEIPYAVTILNSEQLQMKRAYGIDEVVSSIPGVLAQSRAGNQDVRLVIRGFGARGAGDRSNYGTSRGIRVMVDGIPETEPDGRTSFDLLDLGSAENIEVIRSNASATWGNASGGVINISTIPSATNSFAKLKMSSGSFGFLQTQVQVMSKFSDGKIFASASNTNYDGWRAHSSSYRTLINLGITSKLDEKTDLKAFLIGASNVFHVPGPLTQKQFDSNPEQSNITYTQRDERRHNHLGRIGLVLDHQLTTTSSLSGMAFVSPKYLQRSERGTFRDFTRYHIGGNFIYKNRIIFGNDIVNQIVAGVDEAYQDGAIMFYSLSASNGRGNQLKDNKREGANTFGAFLQDELMLNEKLSFILGARFDKVTYYSESFIDTKYGLQEKSFERFTPKAGITFRVSPTLSLYGNLGGGIEVPAGNETDPSGTYGQDLVYLLNPLLEPIISTTYEVGAKHVLSFSNNDFLKYINYDVALYHIQIKNDIVPYRGGRFYFTAGKTSRNGVELGTEIQFTHGVNLRGAFTFTGSTYDDYLVDSVHYGKPNKFASYAGNQSAGIPKVFYNLNISYSPEKSYGLTGSLTLQSVGKYFVDDSNQTEVPAYSVVNATIGLKEGIKISNSFLLSAFFSLNNMFDAKYASSAYINPDIVNGEAYFLEPGLPRNFVLSFSIHLK